MTRHVLYLGWLGVVGTATGATYIEMPDRRLAMVPGTFE